MNASDLGTGAVLSSVALDPHLSQVILAGLAVLVLLIYVGIALPAVWSAKPGRRKAAADVLRQILGALRRQ
jgi:hypothetical protein